MKKNINILSRFFCLFLIFTLLIPFVTVSAQDTVTVAFLGQPQINKLIIPYSEQISDYMGKKLNAEIKTVVGDPIDFDSDDFLNNLVEDILPQAPDAVFIELDISRNYKSGEKDLIARLESVVLAMMESEKVPAIYFIYVPNETLLDNRAPFDKVAQRYGITVLDAFSYLKNQYQAGVLRTSDFLTAGIKIGEQGHTHVARAAINELGAVSDLLKVPKTEVNPLSGLRYEVTVPSEEEKTDVSANENVIFVAADGSDSAAGTIDAPLRTVEGARNKIRSLKKKQGENFGGATVYLRGGRYQIKESIVFTEEDSGAENAPIVYSAYEDEEVSFTNSNKLNPKEFVRVTDLDVLKRLHPSGVEHILQFDLKGAGINPGQFLMDYKHDTKEIVTHSVMGDYTLVGNIFTVDNVGQQRARYPNGGWENFSKPGASGCVYFSGTAPARWDIDKGDAYVRAMFGAGYFIWHAKIASVDMEKQMMSFEGGVGETAKVGWPWQAVNVLEEIDIPGEWYADYKTGILYYYPQDDFLQSELLYSSNYKPLVILDKTKHITLRGITFESSAGSGVEIKDGAYNTVDGCTMRNLGNVGVSITNSGSGEFCNNGVKNSHFYSLGTGGVQIFGGDKATLVPQNDYVENCHFEDFCEIGQHGSGAVNTQDAVGVIIRNCAMHNASASGVYLASNDVTMEYNEMYNLIKEADDTGGVYSQYEGATMQGTRFEHNFMHDILDNDAKAVPRLAGNYGFYMDATAAAGMKVRNNVFYNVPKTIAFNTSQDQFVENNLILDAVQMAIITANSMRGSENGEWHLAVKDYYDEFIENGTLESLRGLSSETRDYFFQIFYLDNKSFTKENQKNYFLKYPWLEHYLDGRYLEARNIMVRNNAIYNSDPANPAIRFDGSIHQKYNVDNYVADDIRFSGKNADDIYAVIDAAMQDAKQNLDAFEVWDVREAGLLDAPKPIGEFRLLGPANNAREVAPDNLYLNWDYASGADKYRVLVATDSEFKNIVFDETTCNSYIKVDGGVETGVKKYYWKVIASSLSDSFTGTSENKGGVYSFYTQRWPSSETVSISAALARAKDKYNTMVVGDKGGEYPAEAKEALRIAIENTESVISQAHPTQERINQAEEEINEAYLITLSKVNIKEIDGAEIFTNPDLLTASLSYNGTIGRVEKAEGVTVTPDSFTLSGTGSIHSTAKYGTEHVLRFTGTYNFNGKTDSYSCVSLCTPSFNWMVYKTANYTILIKDNIIELQAFKPSAPSGEIYVGIPNTSVTPGVPHDFEFAAVPYEKGIRLILRVDGKIVFDHLDNIEPMLDGGHIQINNAGVNANVTIEKPMENTGYPTLCELLNDRNSELYKKAENAVE